MVNSKWAIGLVMALLFWALPTTPASGQLIHDAIVAAGASPPVVHRASVAYVSVAMGGLPLEGERPRVSGIMYDSQGRQYRLRHKPLRADWSQHLAVNLTPSSPLGRYTMHVTFEQGSRAWGLPATIEVVP